MDKQRWMVVAMILLMMVMMFFAGLMVGRGVGPVPTPGKPAEAPKATVESGALGRSIAHPVDGLPDRSGAATATTTIRWT